MKRISTVERQVCLAVGGVVLAFAGQQPAFAETTMSDVAREIAQLKAENRAMRGEIAALKDKSRRTYSTVRSIAERASRTPATAPVAVRSDIPPGATPAFVTADKTLQFGAITITPGGFIAAESVFRTRATQSDINSDFRAVPFGNNPLAHTNEFRFSARQSRVALLAEGAITPTFVAGGYLELDFLGAANTANANESNSFNPRIRHLYATLDNSDYGLHVLAGQNWSLLTMNSKGITPRNEVTPPTIDAQYVPGFAWARQPGIRLTKDFGRRLWLSVAAEASQTTFATACPAGTNVPGTFGINGNFGGTNTITGINCSAAGTGGGFAGDTNNFSLNHVPDVIAKAAYDARLADRDVHLEAFGLYRNLYDRVSYNSTNPATGVVLGQNVNRDTTGYGVGGGLIVPVLPKRLDFQASGLYGRGVGRYGTSQLADTTFNADGSLRPVEEGMALAGFTLHATPAIDLYAFGGIERNFRTYAQNNNAGVGNGSFYGVGAPGLTTANVQGCNIEAAPTANPFPVAQACTSTGAGNTKQIFQLTAGMWDKIYKGSFGEVRVGLQYSFTERQIYNNVPGALDASGARVATNNYQPKANDHMVFTSLRYYPFQ